MTFGFLDVIFGGERTWDRHLQVPKLHLVLSHTHGQHVNALIYKGTFGNKGFENKKLTLLSVV